MNFYKLKCANCGIQEHYIFAQSRQRGVKLKCCICDRQRKHWCNIQILEGVKE